MLPSRFWEKVTKTDGCWVWNGAANPRGYGQFKIDGRVRSAYVLSYEDAAGRVPAGYEVHHTCENHACVRPDHLEHLTSKVHRLIGTRPQALNARKTHCARGHKFSNENTYISRSGSRHCRACHRIRDKHRREK